MKGTPVKQGWQDFISFFSPPLPPSRWKINILKGLSHEIDFKNFDKNLQKQAYLRDTAGF
jgi:hypothetical protein